MNKNGIHPVVVIPIYKELCSWEKGELASLKECCNVLGKHPIYITGPVKLNWEAITQYIKYYYGLNVELALFDDYYFADIPGYNKLLKSFLFYKHFESFSHMLLYQLDAYVFKDELLEWSSKDFDYIGSPWFEGYTKMQSKSILGVGNGGFSLRNISMFINITRIIKYSYSIQQILNDFYLYQNFLVFKRVFDFLHLKILFGFKNFRLFKQLNPDLNINEDYVWSFVVPKLFPSYKIATVEESIKFGFELNPSYLFTLNNNKLPFGCHAWEKHEPFFWKKFIKF